MLEFSTRLDTPTLPPAEAGPASLTACEHLMLVRQLGRLQQQMTVLVRSYELQLGHWQRQLMRQSVRLMLERTRADWGLIPFATHADVSLSAARVVAVAQTDALICRTGCQMDSNHWRDGAQCRLSGDMCAAHAPSSDDVTSTPSPPRLSSGSPQVQR